MGGQKGKRSASRGNNESIIEGASHSTSHDDDNSQPIKRRSLSVIDVLREDREKLSQDNQRLWDRVHQLAGELSATKTKLALKEAQLCKYRSAYTFMLNHVLKNGQLRAHEFQIVDNFSAFSTPSWTVVVAPDQQPAEQLVVTNHSVNLPVQPSQEQSK